MTRAANARWTWTQRDATEEKQAEEAEEEMPLLFMDGLPSDFARNAQLAALLTLMPSDDEERDAAREEDAPHSGVQRRRRQRRATRQHTREPYARGSGDAAAEEKAKKKTATRAASGAQELSLYLSMFRVSNE